VAAVLGCRRRDNALRAAVIRLSFVGVAALLPAPAQAQGLFDLLNSFFGGFLGPPKEPPKSEGPVAYCVRLCDGRYFPLPKNAGTPHSSPDKLCSAMCPASPTKIYTGSGIDQASAADGAPYAKLENAFAYRERIVPDCTCTGKDIGGTAAIDVYSDPTLRPGDIVVTKDGPMVFKGPEQAQHRTSDFVPAGDDKGLPAGVRKTLADMRVTPELNAAFGDFVASTPSPASQLLSSFAQQKSRTPSTPFAAEVPLFSNMLQ
jgi:Protein of unknown function (DUF2865)